MKKQKTVFMAHWINVLIIVASLILGSGLIIFFASRGETMIVDLKLINTYPSENSGSNPYIDRKYAVKQWYIDEIKKSKAAKNIWKQTTAEVLRVVSWGEYDREAWVKVRLRATYDKNRDRYTYNYQALQSGGFLEIQLPNTKINGLITGVHLPSEEKKDPERLVTVQARLTEWSAVFPETRGVESYIPLSFQEGETMTNENGIVAEILEKKSLPAEKFISTADGRVVVGSNPTKQDVYLRLRLRVTQKDGQLFFLYEKPVRIGSALPIILSKISIYPIVTEIESE